MSRYAAARIHALPESLDELVGPTSGAVTLPRHIDWGPRYEYDLADDADLLLEGAADRLEDPSAGKESGGRAVACVVMTRPLL